MDYRNRDLWEQRYGDDEFKQERDRDLWKYNYKNQHPYYRQGMQAERELRQVIKDTINNGKIWPYSIGTKPKGFVHFPNFKIPSMYQYAWNWHDSGDDREVQIAEEIIRNEIADDMGYRVWSPIDLVQVKKNFNAAMNAMRDYQDFMKDYHKNEGVKYLKSKDI